MVDSQHSVASIVTAHSECAAALQRYGIDFARFIPRFLAA